MSQTRWRTPNNRFQDQAPPAPTTPAPIAETDQTSYRLTGGNALNKELPGVVAYFTAKGKKLGRDGGQSVTMPTIEDPLVWQTLHKTLIEHTADFQYVRSSGERIFRLTLDDGSLHLIDVPTYPCALRGEWIGEFLYPRREIVDNAVSGTRI